MALDAKVMGKAVQDACDALPAADKLDGVKCWTAICGAIVDHIKANMEIAIKPANTGLQTSTASGTATNGPLMERTLGPGNVK